MSELAPEILGPQATSTAAASARPLVVAIMAGPGPAARWFEADFPEIRWESFCEEAPSWLERRIRKPNLTLARACWTAVRLARREHARLVVTQDPKVSFRVGEFLKASRKHLPHVAWSFNFARLPGGAKRRLMSHAFAKIDHFIVHSTMERQLYAEHFGLPIDRIEMMRWAMGHPPVDHPERPTEPGEYICALGGNARDYGTLMAAMARLPEIRLVAVLRPHNLEGITVPPNVTVKMGIPIGEAHNILMHSRLMALPLVGTQIPCGHITIVAAMHLGVASIVTGSTGLDDYVHDGVNALTYQALSPNDLASKIRRLWEDRTLCRTLAENGRSFAAEFCSEKLARETLARQFRRFGLLAEVG